MFTITTTSTEQPMPLFAPYPQAIPLWEYFQKSRESCKSQIHPTNSTSQPCLSCLVVDPSKTHVIGAVLVGDTSDYDTLLQYALNEIAVPEAPESLILPSAGEAPTLGADALGDAATICSCYNVSKGDIIDAIDGGCCSVGDVKGATSAGTGCGGCAALLKNVVDSEAK